MRWGKAWTALSGSVVLLTGCVSENKIVPPETVPPHLLKPAKVEERQPQVSTLAAAGTMYLDQGAAAKDAAARQQYFEQATKAFQQALAREPHNIQALHGMARLLEKQGQFQPCCQYYVQLLTLQPQNAVLHHEYGWCLARQKQWPEAAALFQKATELDPRNAAYARDWGFTLARTERFEESVAVFRRHHSESQAYFRVAQMAKHLQRNDVCRQYLQMALQAEPQMQEAQQLLASLDQGNNAVVQTGGTSQGAPPAQMPTEPAPPVPPQQ
jgi:tetratricopeptide (TPR) repeat protein